MQIIYFILLFIKRRDKLIEINCPREFIDIMPYNTVDYTYKYWIEQIDLEYSQYYYLSIKKLQTWLNSKKKMFDSIMQYAEKRDGQLIHNSKCRKTCYSRALGPGRTLVRSLHIETLWRMQLKSGLEDFDGL